MRARLVPLGIVLLLGFVGGSLAQRIDPVPQEPADAAQPRAKCLAGFAPIRAEGERVDAAIKAARHVPARELCELFGRLAEAQARMVEYLEQNSRSCDIPVRIISSVRTRHAKTLETRRKVCASKSVRVEPKGSRVPSPRVSSPPSQPATKGSGFVVNASGDILTNEHVVRGCTDVRVRLAARPMEAIISATDSTNDLAVLRAPTGERKPLAFREGRAIRPGDEIVLVGFPYSGLLASSPTVSIGAVSALAGLRDDPRFLQISAPVQPGNSGGPLLDSSGNVVGIVVATINALAVLRITGTVPQNLNFAIKGAIVQQFLDAQHIAYEKAASGAKSDLADVGERGSQSAVLVECRK